MKSLGLSRAITLIFNIMTPIITNSLMTFQERLIAGQSWEKWLVELLNSLGIQAYRPNQNGLYNCKDKTLFTSLQRDIHIKQPNSVKRTILEVKARTNSPFNFKTVDVGMLKAWLAKAFKPAYVAVIDQNSREVKFANADKDYRESDWVIRQSNDEAYSVPKEKFISLEDWIRQFKLKFNIA